ncbi:multidrug ABC transporter ATP-binding protein [Actinoplanes philippinensis]|uniref:Putative ABC transport system ATP-binding protein n=1 Tax=Actinoplanes philippinensis TaxID=35752 RepID=A0A1I2KJ51_9ACTN|nr:ABC transporter ATP-binding protein [Actinoplanes philippinensis]GIE81957.1 multidrug ABC transporter ATP-binding protein [Actinoplanes philippinensis]SFF64976.1 putative ABC transport system ATP-binding protein [Actinoplanes philippinensis]
MRVPPSPDRQRTITTGLAPLAGRAFLPTALRFSPQLRQGLLVTGLLALLAGGGRIVAPLSIQRAIDAGLAPGTVTPAVTVGGVAVLVAGLSSLLLNRRLQEKVENALAGLRRDGLRRVHDMAASTADRVPSADLVSRLTSDVDQVTTFLQGGGIQFVTNSAQLLIAAVIMSVFSWQLAVPVLLLSALLIGTMTLMQRVIARRYAQARRELSRLQSVVAESVAGAPVIRSTGTAARAARKLDDAVDRARDSLLRTLVPLHGNTALGEVTIGVMTVTVLLGGVWFALAGDPARPRLSSGEVVAMVFLVTFFVRPLQFLVQSLGEAQNALTGWRRALELAATPREAAGDGPALPAGPLGVRMSQVSARYGSGPLVLRSVSVSIEPGEHVAVVGRTGSGKSTFAKLLTRRVLASTGTIHIGGVALDRITSLAGRVVIVPQDPFLFDATIAENIRLGSPTGSAAGEISRIMGDLGLDDWLSGLPDGLDTRVGLRGERLSVGERQLVALARTALAGPDLVIFDEATSGVDPATDVTVQKALAILTRGRTSIAIAHRMITAETADRVLVFDGGRIVQSGHHSVLATRPGPYSALVDAWRTP